MNADQFPPVLLGKALHLWFSNRVMSHTDAIGRVIHEEEPFVIFRKVVVLQKDNTPADPDALFKVKFEFAKFSFAINKRLSLIPIPFIIAQPGFISKTWRGGTETGSFQGLYEWESLQSAENYVDSLPLKLMKKRARPYSLKTQIKKILIK